MCLYVAQQMILSEPLRQALLRNDPKILKELLSQYQQGFWAVLEQMARILLTAPGTSAFANVAACLDGFGITNYRPGEYSHIITLLREALAKVTSWAPFSAEVSSGLAAACRLSSTRHS